MLRVAEDNKGPIKIHIYIERKKQKHGKARKITKRQTAVYKSLQRKLMNLKV